jgi:hypothetical protein
METVTGRWSKEEFEDLLAESSRIEDVSERIGFLSRFFLGTEYEESTLRGSPEEPEVLVINLASVDCFTLLDYIEAMRRSSSYAGFVENLKKVRYRRGEVSFRQRNHFFTDWRESNAEFVRDVTTRIGKGSVIRVKKMLNEKEGGNWVQGIPARQREIDYIPSPLPEGALSALMTGDYAGVYSASPGLDVSHLGIVVRSGRIIFRHASSKQGRVVDEDLEQYFSEKPGMIVLRPKRPGDL